MTIGRMSFWWNSLFGRVECRNCGKSWPCHLMVWGSTDRGPSKCAVCGERAIYWADDDE